MTGATALPGRDGRTRYRPAGIGWPVVAGLAWFVRFATLGHVLPWQKPIWAGWFDQGRYLSSALALARGDLSPGQHWYPLGYPLAAVPFAWVLPADPFLPLDLMLFLVTCRGFQRVVARLGVATGQATACFLATTIVQTGLASAWAQPWTSTLSAALLWWLADRTIAVLEAGRAPRRGVLLAVGALAGALPLVRPVDALPGLTSLAIVGAALVRRRALSPSAVLAVAAGGAAACLPYLALHLAIYGPHATRYMTEAARTGFVPGDLGWKAYVILLDPGPWYPDPYSRPMLAVLPWTLPGLAGLIARGIAGARGERAAIAVLLALSVPVTVLMLTYADLQPPGLWYFGNVHYFKWVMPMLGCGLILAWRLAWTRRGRPVVAATLGVLLLPLGLRLRPVPVADGVPARMLLYRGDAGRDWQEAYFAPATVTDDRGPLANVNGFHQLPDGGGERAIAVRRLFAGHPRRSDPGELRCRAGQLPYARYGERLSWPF